MPNHPDRSSEARSSEAERRVVELLAAARATVRAPDSLRARIEARHRGPSTPLRRRIAYGTALAAALAAGATVLVLALPGGAPGGPSVSQAAALATLRPTAGAPPADVRAPQRLEVGVEDVYFPNWTARFGWRATGRRTDRLDGRRATTVFYEWHGRRLAYTIVSAPALAQPPAPTTTRDGTRLRTLTLDGRTVVTWRRANHTCVLSGAGVSARVLQELAAWKAPRASD